MSLNLLFFGTLDMHERNSNIIACFLNKTIEKRSSFFFLRITPSQSLFLKILKSDLLCILLVKLQIEHISKHLNKRDINHTT